MNEIPFLPKNVWTSPARARYVGHAVDFQFASKRDIANDFVGFRTTTIGPVKSVTVFDLAETKHFHGSFFVLHRFRAAD